MVLSRCAHGSTATSERVAVPLLSLVLLVGLAAPVRGQNARVELDVRYATEDTAQTLDLYLPQAERFATVLFIHGGSLRRGYDRHSEEYADVCRRLVESGVGCATTDYRVAPSHQWPAMPSDVAAAVRWVRDRVGERGGDPERLFLFGHSSGCHLAAVLGTNPKYLAEVDLRPDDLAGVVAMGCILTPLDRMFRNAAEQDISLDSLRARWNADPDDRFASFDDRLDSDPSRFVGPHVPPTLVVVAQEERFLPPIMEQGARFIALLYEAKRPADLVIVPGSHMTSIANLGKPGDPTLAAVLEFIADPEAAGTGSRPTSIGR